MSELTRIHICPNGCPNATFITAAHVMQDWEVDAEGEFLKTVDDCAQVDHGPDNGNIWACSRCGAEAEMIICRKRKITMPDSTSPTGSKPCFLYTETGVPAPRAYFATHGTSGLFAAPVEPDGQGGFSASISDMKIKID